LKTSSICSYLLRSRRQFSIFSHIGQGPATEALPDFLSGGFVEGLPKRRRYAIKTAQKNFAKGSIKSKRENHLKLNA
jgi:hypothetical protein